MLPDCWNRSKAQQQYRKNRQNRYPYKSLFSCRRIRLSGFMVSRVAHLNISILKYLVITTLSLTVVEQALLTLPEPKYLVESVFVYILLSVQWLFVHLFVSFCPPFVWPLFFFPVFRFTASYFCFCNYSRYLFE